MKFSLEESISILERTPRVLKAYLIDLSDNWIRNNEGKDTWSPYDIVGHLIHGEKTDWIPRMQIILGKSDQKKFKEFDRSAQFNENQNQSINDLLDQFEELRKKNLEILKTQNLNQKDLNAIGIHPEFGKVSLQELIATWTVHDLGHIAQISRVMAKQYKQEVGSWINYLGVLNK